MRDYGLLRIFRCQRQYVIESKIFEPIYRGNCSLPTWIEPIVIFLFFKVQNFPSDYIILDDIIINYCIYYYY